MIHFEERTHTYWDGDERLPSVTEILQTVYRPYQNVPPETLKAAADRGTAIHAAILQGGPQPDWMSGYIHAWQAACEELPIGGPLETEIVVFHPTMRYAGTADMLAPVKGVRCVLEIKSCPLMPWHALQAVAYAESSIGNEGAFPRHCVLLSLAPTGYYYRSLSGQRYEQALRQWMSTLACYRFIESKPRWWEG